MITPGGSLRILLDHSVPRPLARLIPGHEVGTASDEGWSELSNGDLLAAAEIAAFDCLVTADRNLNYQQNLQSRRIAIVVICKRPVFGV
jgi:hypothetical protein